MAWLALAPGAATLSWAQGQGAAPEGAAEVVVTGSIVQRAIVEAPYAIGVVDRDTLRGAGPMVNLSEAMGRVPGVVVANRSNYAQDLQISSRGFGARAGFGVRGIRLYTDGIPASGPDGQGQVSHFDLAGAERVEVLRGPFSVLYGNSSGGVIALESAPVRRRSVEGSIDLGSFGLRQARAELASPLPGGFDVRLGAASLAVDGFRPHSEAERRLLTGRLGWKGTRDSVVVLVNDLDQPADDPLGLTREQFDADPLQTTPQALQFGTRKTTRQTQGGLRWKHRFDDGPLRESEVALYTGRRAIVQFLAIAPATQANARHGGGVIDFERQFQGIDARLRWNFGALDVLTGVALDRQRDDRRGYENFTGSGASQELGVVGKLRRDEVNRARSEDGYLQAEWALARDWTVSGGLRSGRVELSAADRYLSNGDDSGERRFTYTNPVIGMRWQAQPGLNVHASMARGFESPTLGELAYRRDGTGGFNTELLPQRSRQFEVGAKWRARAWQFDLTAFEARVADEIGVATNAGGRSSFQNVGRTLRRGIEFGARLNLAPQWSAALAATALRATYQDPFLVCAGIPCTAPTLTVSPGNRIAGTQPGSGFAELAWRGRVAGLPGEAAVEWRGVGPTTANDRNTEVAGGYGVVGLRWTQRFTVAPGWAAEWLLRVDNVFDRRYAGSVIVNDANARFYETGVPRSFMVAVRLTGL